MYIVKLLFLMNICLQKMSVVSLERWITWGILHALLLVGSFNKWSNWGFQCPEETEHKLWFVLIWVFLAQGLSLSTFAIMMETKRNSMIQFHSLIFLFSDVIELMLWLWCLAPSVNATDVSILSFPWICLSPQCDYPRREMKAPLILSPSEAGYDRRNWTQAPGVWESSLELWHSMQSFQHLQLCIKNLFSDPLLFCLFFSKLPWLPFINLCYLLAVAWEHILSLQRIRSSSTFVSKWKWCMLLQMTCVAHSLHVFTPQYLTVASPPTIRSIPTVVSIPNCTATEVPYSMFLYRAWSLSDIP